MGRAGVALSAGAARAVYDRVGRRQDTQRFYEDPAVDRLLQHADLGGADAVFELGCGTGRLAERLLAHHLPAAARYQAVDVSPTMVRLTRARLLPWAERAEVALIDGDEPLPAGDASCDRVIATYMFDLLGPTETAAALGEARRILRPNGRLCLAGLTPGTTAAARVIDRAWTAIWRRAPALLGGCRPIAMAPLLAERGWRVEHCDVVTAWARSSEVLLARPS